MRTTELITGAKKAAALSFLRLAASGQAREAFRQHAADNFRHHNPGYPGDARSLIAGMEEQHGKFPDTSLDIVHALEDGDLVAVHSRVTRASSPVLAVVHLLRFEGDRVAEFWDVGQEEPDDSPNEFGMF